MAWEVAEESGRDTCLLASVLESQLTCSFYLDLVAANSGAVLLLEGQQNSSQMAQGLLVHAKGTFSSLSMEAEGLEFKAGKVGLCFSYI